MSGIVETLKKCRIPNVAQHIDQLKKQATSNQITKLEPTERTNRQGRKLARFDPAAQPVGRELIAAKKKPAAQVRDKGTPQTSQPIAQEESQPPQSLKATAAGNPGEPDPEQKTFTMPTVAQLKGMAVATMASKYTKEQLIEISVMVGLLEADIQGRGNRQIAGLIKKEIG